MLVLCLALSGLQSFLYRIYASSYYVTSFSVRHHLSEYRALYETDWESALAKVNFADQIVTSHSQAPEPIRQTRPKPYHFLTWYDGSQCKMSYHVSGLVIIISISI